MIAYFALIFMVVVDFVLEFFWNKQKTKTEHNVFLTRAINFIFKYRVITIISFVFLTTFRAYSVGYDTMNYYEYYELLRQGKISLFTAIATPFEFGYTMLNSVLALIGFDFRILILIISTFSAVCMVLFINKFSCNKIMSIMMYIMLGIFAQSISAMRQIVAIDFVLLALICLSDKKWIKSTILIALGATFHVSGLLCLILIPLRYIKLNYWHCIIAVTITILGSLLFPSILKLLEDLTPLDFYSKYLVNYTGYIESSGIMDNLYSIALILLFGILFVGFKKFLKLNEKNSENFGFLINIYLIVPLIRIAGFICNMQALFNRVSMYFFVALIILIPLFLAGIEVKTKKMQIVLHSMAYLIGTAYMIYLYAIKISCGAVPYVFGF